MVVVGSARSSSVSVSVLLLSSVYVVVPGVWPVCAVRVKG